MRTLCLYYSPLCRYYFFFHHVALPSLTGRKATLNSVTESFAPMQRKPIKSVSENRKRLMNVFLSDVIFYFQSMCSSNMCFFSSFASISHSPTPNVRWKRQDNRAFSSRVLQGNSGGQELVIKDLQFEDAGTYLCDASRIQDSSVLEMSINLNVNCEFSLTIKSLKEVHLCFFF